jgi:hypothetical protein
VFAQTERQPSSVRCADEVRTRCSQLVEDRQRIRHPERHGVGLKVVRRVAAADPSVVDEYDPELCRIERPDDDAAPQHFDGIQQPAVDHDRGRLPASVLEPDPSSIKSVDSERHGFSCPLRSLRFSGRTTARSVA